MWCCWWRRDQRGGQYRWVVWRRTGWRDRSFPSPLWNRRRFLHGWRDVAFGTRLRALRHFLSAAFGYGGRNPRSFRFPRARRGFLGELGGEWPTEAGDAEGQQPDAFHRAAPAIGANEALVFQTLHQLNHPAFRKTSQLGEKRHFYLAPAPVGRLRAWRCEQLNQRATQSGLCRRHDFQQPLEVDLPGYVCGPGPSHLLKTGPVDPGRSRDLQRDLVVRHATGEELLSAAARLCASAETPPAPAT